MHKMNRIIRFKNTCSASR